MNDHSKHQVSNKEGIKTANHQEVTKPADKTTPSQSDNTKKATT